MRDESHGRLRIAWKSRAACAAVPFCFVFTAIAADLPGSKDPPGIQRYRGSEIIGYRAPWFDEFVLPLGPPTPSSSVEYEKSIKTEGLVSRYTYLAPQGRSPAELALADVVIYDNACIAEWLAPGKRALYLGSRRR